MAGHQCSVNKYYEKGVYITHLKGQIKLGLLLSLVKKII